ncbi:hypothetical protein [Sphingomonas sp. Leaf357]|uniref:hypothetical protein n=1 Tax=Sphingomonas sp. Leaf357 TaxID=1736350 RepID=UPI000A680102|nr:hypothetical protein [Sphingomonas sp. Leaf357]
MRRELCRVGDVNVVAGRTIAGIALGALVAAGIAVAPAIGAPESGNRTEKRVSLTRGAGSFTPASADPRLAAVFARGGLDSAGFSFTPSESRRAGSHAVTVAVRARSTRSAMYAERNGVAASVAAPQVSLAPIAYNLGVAVGWKRFALSSDVGRVDMAGLPGSRERMDLGLSYTGKRFSGQVKAISDRPLAGAPKLVEEAPNYALDVGGSYSLTRNLDVTAGVRYKTERDRLERLKDDNRLDSQAVYIGTAFRF